MTMKAWDVDFYYQMTYHLNSLQESDYDDRDLDNLISDPTMITEISEEAKAKLYKDSEFKKFLQSYMKKQYKKDMPKVSNKFSEKIYRKLYYKNILANPNMYSYTKVMYHPDVTTTDYQYIREKLEKFPSRIIYNQLGLFAILGYAYFKTPFGVYAKTNLAQGAAIIGLSPMLVLLGTQKLNSFLLNKRVKDMKLPEKYFVKLS